MIIILGVASGLFGIAILVCAIVISTRAAWMTEIFEVDETGVLVGAIKTFQAMVYVLGIVMALMGFVSFCAVKKRGCGSNCCCLFFYMSGIYSAWILCLVMMIFPMTIYSVTPTRIDSFCEEANKYPDFDESMGEANHLAAQMQSTIGSVDFLTAFATDAIMCSPVCPCPKLDQNLWDAENKDLFATAKTFSSDLQEVDRYQIYGDANTFVEPDAKQVTTQEECQAQYKPEGCADEDTECAD